MSERKKPFFTPDQISLPSTLTDDQVSKKTGYSQEAMRHIEEGRSRGGQGLSKKEKRSMEKRGIPTDPNLRRLERIKRR